QHKSREHAQRVVNQMLDHLYGDGALELSVRQYAAQWLQGKKPSVSASTYAFYSGTIGQFLKWLGAKAEDSIRKVSKQTLIEYRSWLETQLSIRSANHHLGAIRMFFSGAARDYLIESSPCQYIEAIRERGTTSKRRAFTVDELRALLAIASPE